MKMIKYDGYGSYIREDKIVGIISRKHHGGVIIFSEDGKEYTGNLSAQDVLDQLTDTQEDT